jgi:aryl-alcohol dehydrogenase-like predicted oxidoreductase
MTMKREQGFGCMGWSAFYKTCSDEEAVAVFQAAVSSGVTLFNTATFYGPLNEPGFGTNLRVLKKCLATVDRSKVQIMCKICMDTRVIYYTSKEKKMH